MRNNGAASYITANKAAAGIRCISLSGFILYYRFREPWATVTDSIKLGITPIFELMAAASQRRAAWKWIRVRFPEIKNGDHRKVTSTFYISSTRWMPSVYAQFLPDLISNHDYPCKKQIILELLRFTLCKQP